MKVPQTVFYLDDDTDDLYFFKEIMDSLGHDAHLYINGNELLKSLKKGILPDIIFLDIRMPVFDGEQILDIIRKEEEWKHIPIVMLSGVFPKSAIPRYLGAGANYLMKKSLDLDDLKVSLEKVLAIDWDNFRAYN